MDQNEEFWKKLACLQCGRHVQSKPKWYRLHKQANGFLFYYRCVKCHSEYKVPVSTKMLPRLAALGITPEGTPTASTSIPQVDVNTSWTYFTFPKFHRKRKERREMKKYRRAFNKQLRAKGNECLSAVVSQEGKNRKS